MSNVEKRCVEKDQQLRELNEDLRLTRVSHSSKEGKPTNNNYYVGYLALFLCVVELRHLQDQIQVRIESHSPVSCDKLLWMCRLVIGQDVAPSRFPSALKKLLHIARVSGEP